MEFTSFEISCRASLLRASTFQRAFWGKGGEVMTKGYHHDAVRISPWKSLKIFDKPDASFGRHHRSAILVGCIRDDR